MIIILLENQTNYFLSFVDKLAENLQQSSIGSIGHKTKVSDALAMYKKSPLFDQGWLIKCNSYSNFAAIRQVEAANSNNIIVIRVFNQKEVEKVKDKLNDCKYRYIDNFKLKKADVLEWIDKELECGLTNASLIYSKAKGRSSNILQAVGILASCENVGYAEISKYVKGNKEYTANDLFRWIVRDPRPGMKKKDAITVIQNYQYGYKWLFKFLTESLEDWIFVYELALDGVLSLQNFQTFRKSGDVKRLKDFSEGQLRGILEHIGLISYEYLVTIHGLIKNIDLSSRLACFKLIKLLEVGGNYSAGDM